MSGEFRHYVSRSALTVLWACLLLLILRRSATAQSISERLVTRPFVHHGYSRPYLIYTPNHLASRPAVVFMLGGVGSSARSTSEEFGWTGEADRNGFVVVFPAPVQRDPSQAFAVKANLTFWEMQGSRSHVIGLGKQSVDDDGYLMDVLHDVLRSTRADRKRVFFAGFSSGSGMAQLLASRHPHAITAVAAVATPLMEPPARLIPPVSILYIHGDLDEAFSGFEVNSPHFATTPHGNWVTWGFLDGCRRQTATRKAWGVQMDWGGCRSEAKVRALLIKDLGHEWVGSAHSTWLEAKSSRELLPFTDLAWTFFAELHSR